MTELFVEEVFKIESFLEKRSLNTTYIHIDNTKMFNVKYGREIRVIRAILQFQPANVYDDDPPIDPFFFGLVVKMPEPFLESPEALVSSVRSYDLEEVKMV